MRLNEGLWVVGCGLKKVRAQIALDPLRPFEKYNSYPNQPTTHNPQPTHWRICFLYNISAY